MQTSILKKEVLELLQNADDTILLKVKDILQLKYSTWDELPVSVQNNILLGKKQIAEGKFNDEETVMEKYKSWIGK
jgi:hypothetical protein